MICNGEVRRAFLSFSSSNNEPSPKATEKLEITHAISRATSHAISRVIVWIEVQVFSKLWLSRFFFCFAVDLSSCSEDDYDSDESYKDLRYRSTGIDLHCWFLQSL